jgi:hypothetical protein
MAQLLMSQQLPLSPSGLGESGAGCVGLTSDIGGGINVNVEGRSEQGLW